jgi:hypothetical protein
MSLDTGIPTLILDTANTAKGRMPRGKISVWTNAVLDSILLICPSRMGRILSKASIRSQAFGTEGGRRVPTGRLQERNGKGRIFLEPSLTCRARGFIRGQERSFLVRFECPLYGQMDFF